MTHFTQADRAIPIHFDAIMRGADSDSLAARCGAVLKRVITNVEWFRVLHGKLALSFITLPEYAVLVNKLSELSYLVATQHAYLFCRHYDVGEEWVIRSHAVRVEAVDADEYRRRHGTFGCTHVRMRTHLEM